MSRSDVSDQTSTVLDYWNLFQELPTPCLLFKADDPDFTIVDMNRARARQTLTTREAKIGKPLFKAFPNTGSYFLRTGDNDLLKEIRHVIKTGRPKQLELERLETFEPGGEPVLKYWQRTYVPLKDKTGKVTHVLAATLDMTDELSREKRTAEVESRLEAALSIGKVGSWAWDIEKDEAMVDATVAKFLGITKRHGTVGLPKAKFLESVHPADRDRVNEALERAVANRLPLDEEFRMQTPSGKIRWVLVRGKLENHDGHMVFPGVIVDVTERRDLQAQIELARKQDQLNRQAAKILQERNEELEAIARTKDEFVALASHQLRTPATAVKQYLGMVLQGYVGDISDMQAEMLGKAFESNERQIQIINQILNAARVDTGRLVLTTAPVDLCSLMQAIASDMKSMFDAHAHKLKLVVPKRPVPIAADMGYLRMAVENIVNNAIIYTPDGGVITLKLSNTGKRCQIVITDTGVGIRKSDLGKLFIKFSRIHNPLSVQAGGSGIGLYLAAEIVRLHDGTVTVESDIGKGTTFAISLPLVHNTI